MTPSESTAKAVPVEDATIRDLKETFDAQKSAFYAHPAPTYEHRMANLAKLKRMVADNKERIVATIVADFGHKSRHETMMAEIFTTLNNLKYTEKRLAKWMRPQRRHVGLEMQPARAYVVYQPKGVVGIMAPWNYPFYLAMVPLTTALAAGNRVMIKPSEITPRTSELMAELIAATFDRDEVHVVTGGPEVGAAFAQQPWDHLFFTGSTHLGRIVMRAAAENLTPVTLELGGKSPLIIHPSYPLDKAAKRILGGKYMNAGQTCVAPDYIMVHEDQVQSLVNVLKEQVAAMYPTIANNPDYTAVVNERHYERLQSYLKDARDKGATIIEINPAGETIDPATRKLPPTVVLGVTDDMRIAHEEIFGPILIVHGYKTLDEAIRYINERPRPLALYYFDNDRERADHVLSHTVSGNACINETVMHVGVDDLPFGGVGASGMGAYHGFEGFETFSHKKGILERGRINPTEYMSPPYGKWMDTLLKLLVR